tara:strand:+ start:485 stop:2137 length:1653 start_codon:yes stop_codon:yes gene_type:complete
MCGIYALLCSQIKSDYEIEKIKKQFQKGSKRGPEHSSFSCISSSLGVYFGFHRLAINGLDEISHQPLQGLNCQVICNGEIYNHKEIFENQNVTPETNSDCESILPLYMRNGVNCVYGLNGPFAFILYDTKKDQVLVARDPYGVRPLYECLYEDNTIGFASDVEPLLFPGHKMKHIKAFPPGSFALYNKVNTDEWKMTHLEKYFNPLSYQPLETKGIEYYMYEVVQRFQKSIWTRINNCERDIASLLSGGLDSSLVSAYVKRFYEHKTSKTLHTYSIGLPNGEDLKFAKKVASHIGSDHTEILMTNKDFIDSVPSVIQDIESYDTTTVRASVGNWNIGRYISQHSDAKVIFNGDGADELMGGYMYFHCCPNSDEFHKECVRLLSDIHRFDVLRSDKSISSHGLEPRSPFLDNDFTKFYLSIPIEYRNHNDLDGKHRCEKYFLRKSIEVYDPHLLPHDVLWRKKEAFSDGVSSHELSWYEILQNHVNTMTFTLSEEGLTKEQQYYRMLFRNHYPSCCDTLIPYYWMPRYVKNAKDASARTLDVYHLLNTSKD